MNFHNNGVTLRGSQSIRESQSSGKESKQLYDSVFSKHYQIIQSFLQRINELYNKHDEFQHAINTLEDKIEKLEISSKNIHYEFRTTHLMLDKKISSINTDYNNLQEQIKIIQMDMPIDSYLSSTHFLAKTSQLRSRSKKNRNKERKASQNYRIEIHSNQDLNATTPGIQGRQSLKNSSNKLDPGPKMMQLSALANKTEGMPEKTVSFDCLSSHSSHRDIDTPGNTSMLVNNQSDEDEDQAQHQCTVNEQFIRDEIKRELETNNQQFAAQLAKLNEKNTKLSLEIQQKIVKQQEKWTQHLKTLQKDILGNIDKKLEAIKIEMHVTLNSYKGQFLNNNKEIISNLQQIDQKIAQKVDNEFFQASLNNLSAAITHEFSKQEKLFPNKVQTKKALDFLQKKINRLIVQDVSLRSKKQFTGMDDPCLKINKCQSNKRLDCLSEKSIKDRLDDFNYNSLDTSMRDIEGVTESQTSNVDDNRLKKTISNIISWRNPVLKSVIPHDDHKFLKSTSKAKEMIREKSSPVLSKTLSVHHAQSGVQAGAETPVNEKQWRDKVVKVLKKDGVRKRKVTFR